MKNNRSLFPPLFSEVSTGGGGGGSGNKIQLAELPEASLEYKDKIVQYIGATTETLTNGYFYKCVEHTTTEGGTITVTYSWDSVAVMEVDGGYKLVSSVSADGAKTFGTLFSELMKNVTISENKIYLLKIIGGSGVYYETSRPISGGKLGFYQTFYTGAQTITDNILISAAPSEVKYIMNNNDVTDSVAGAEKVIKLFAISVDSAI